ncbi:MAG: DUF1573 domain-containing protein [Paludibacter sp.]|nr:DUF1573 domain-containing protein [Paludibacter sp.]
MKKIFYAIGFVIITLNAHSQTNTKNTNDSAVIVFADTIFDFGTIKEADGKVTHVFEFKNDGKSPLVVLDAKASCGCTVPEWTKTPIESGQSGVLEVTYNPAKRGGVFTKSVTVKSNAVGQVRLLYITGTVEPSVTSKIGHFSNQLKRHFGMWDFILGGIGLIIIGIAVNMILGQKKKNKVEIVDNIENVENVDENDN